MAAFTRVWNPPLVFNQPPGSAALNALDANMANAINSQGGSWSPVTPIIIGGAGLEVTGPATWSGTTTITGAFSVTGVVTINGSAGSAISLALGSTLTNNGATVLNGTVTIDAAQSVVFDAAKTYTRTIDHPPIYNSAQWGPALDAESLLPVFASATISGGQTELVWAWRPPTGATVTEASVFLTPAGAHAGVPSVVLAVTKLLRTSVAAANLHSQADTSANVVAYETPHALTVTGMSITFTEGDLLVVRLSPETGANALTNLKVAPPIITFTRTTLGEE